MRAEILGLLAETPLHPGVGQEEGTVDLPVAREEPFGIPVVPGSGLKGAMREKRWAQAYGGARSAGEADEGAQRTAKDEADADFGRTDEAGPLAVSDARLLLLPVRALDRLYRWVTCPYLLERWARDLARARSTLPPPTLKVPPTAERVVLAEGGGRVFLEGLDFEVRADQEGVIESIVTSLRSLVGHPDVAARLQDQLALVSDDMFGHFARRALPVTARNVLDRRKVSQNLFYEETLPTDSLLYAVAAERNDGALRRLNGLFPKDDPYLRLGGNETLGQGWCRVVRKGDAP